MHPIFVRLRHRIGKAEQELVRIDKAMQMFDELTPNEAVTWARRTSLAAGIESVYSEIENVLKAIAVEIDGYMPMGEDWHAKLLEIMALSIKGTRPAILSSTTREDLDALRRFRHVIRNRYGLDLCDDGINDNFHRLKAVLPAFKADFERFVTAISAGIDAE